jgi:hypothetical protein
MRLCSIPTLTHSRDATDAAAQQFAAKQLRLSSAGNDLDGFVEIELDRDG